MMMHFTKCKNEADVQTSGTRPLPDSRVGKNVSPVTPAFDAHGHMYTVSEKYITEKYLRPDIYRTEVVVDIHRLIYSAGKTK